MRYFTNLSLAVLLFCGIAFAQKSVSLQQSNLRTDLLEKILLASPFKKGDTKADLKKALLNKISLDNGYVLEEQLLQYWVNGAWVNESRHNYLYDSNNNIIDELTQSFDDVHGNIWVNLYDEINTYDGNGDMSLKEIKLWNYDTSTWGDNIKQTYEYDGNHNETKETFSAWTGSEWAVDHTVTYTYNQNLLTEMVTQINNNNMLENWNNISYSYDSNGNTTIELDQTWENNVWKNLNRYEYSYDGDRITEIKDEAWGNTSWITADIKTYTYDDTNNTVTMELQGVADVNYKEKEITTYNSSGVEISYLGLNWGNGDWVNNNQEFSTVDENNNITSTTGQHWENESWINDYKYFYSYNSTTDVETINYSVSDYKLFNNYPNPFNPSTTIGFSIPKQSFVTLKVYDLLGREVATLVNEELQAGSYKTQFNASSAKGGLASGVYLYRLNAGGFIQTKKLMLMK